MKAIRDFSEDEARRIFGYLMYRAATDITFRRALLTDPGATLARELDLDLQDDFDIRFVENEGADVTIVLPDPIMPEGALPEEELGWIAGGAGVNFYQMLARYFEGRRQHDQVSAAAAQAIKPGG